MQLQKAHRPLAKPKPKPKPTRRKCVLEKVELKKGLYHPHTLEVVRKKSWFVNRLKRKVC